MAGNAFKLADPNIGAVLVDNTGRQTPYYQRFIQATNRQISISIGGLEAVVAAQADQQLEILAAQADIIEQQDLLEDLSDYAIQSNFYLSGKAGMANASPNGSGDATIFHNFGTDPGTLGACKALPTGTTPFLVQMQSVDADNLIIRLFDLTGTPITTGTWSVAYQVTVYPLPPF